MRPGQFIKHKRYMDICLEIKSCHDYGHGIEIKVEAWNMGFVDSFPLGIKFRVNIAKTEKDIKESSGRNTQLSEWQRLSDRTAKCFRNCEWIDLR